MPAQSPSVLIMARAPRRGEVRQALEPLLGSERCARLQALLIAGAARWAGQLAPDAVYVAHDPPDAARELRPLVGESAALFPQNGEGIARRLADASARVFAQRPGPLLIVWPELPVLGPANAHAALGDLEEGCDLVLGPMFDGGFYLVAVAGPLQELFNMPERSWRNADSVRLGLDAVARAGVELGILRAERGLRRPADVRAALADPCLPEEVARVLKAG